jgi:hypothetical protein
VVPNSKSSVQVTVLRETCHHGNFLCRAPKATSVERGSEAVFVTSHGVLRGPVVILEKERQRRLRGESLVGERKKERRIVFWLGFILTVGLFNCHVSFI